MNRFTECLAALILLGGSGLAFSTCLDAPESTVISADVTVSNASELQSAIGSLEDNQTILLQAGTYELEATLWINKSNVSIVGDSTRCDEVILVGNGMENSDYDGVPYGIWTNQEGLTVKNLTIKDTWSSSIILNYGAHNAHIYNVALVDAGEQFIKSNPQDYGDGNTFGIVEYTSMVYSSAPPADPSHPGGTGYTNGIDVHGGEGWIIRHNLFQNFHTPDEADHLWNAAVHIWNGSKDMIVESNQFINVDRAIAFGIYNRGEDEDGNQINEAEGGIIANNMIYYSEGLFSASRTAGSDAAIIAWTSPGTLIAHNTIINNGNQNHAIESRWNGTEGVTIMNNFTDDSIDTGGDSASVASNNITIPSTDIFTDPASADLHLTEALDASYLVDLIADASEDFDGNDRSTSETVYPGADQYTESNRPMPPQNVILIISNTSS